jgi:hypothetical protein
MNYKLLEPEFTKNGFRFRQIWREGDFAVFHKVAMEGNIHPTTYDAGFETVVVSRHDGYEIAGNKVEPAECYPSNELWGDKGWTYKTLHEAQIKFEILTGKRQATIKPIPVLELPDPNEVKRTRRPRNEIVMLNIPAGEFTTKELAEYNKVEYSASFLWIKDEVGKTLKVAGSRKIDGQRGRASVTYTKV